MKEERRDIFLSCFKCGRIVKSSDAECPRCGLLFGPGTLFECPFCSGLIWRNATACTTCGIDLTKFSENVEKASKGFDMDQFVDSLLTTELKEMKDSIRRVACPGCGLMIRGDEDKCPRCDLPLEQAQVDCPVCGEKVPITSESCGRCGAQFVEKPVAVAGDEEELEPEAVLDEEAPVAKRKPAKKPAAPKKKPAKKGRPRKGQQE